MATARIVANQGGRSMLPNNFFTFEEVLHVEHHRKEDSTTFSFLVDQGNLSMKSGLGRKKKLDDEEIDIFPAEKYFSGDIMINNMGSKQLVSPKKEMVVHKIRSGTPSICSELSRNSRSSLLWPAGKDSIRNLKTQSRGRRFINILRCKYCSGDKSVHVKSPSVLPHEIKQVQSEFKHGVDISCRSKKEGQNFSFPISLNHENNSIFGMELIEEKSVGTLIEGFGSPIIEKRNRSSFTLLTLGHGASGGDGNNDNESESSSELFEIESFSTKYPQFLPSTEATCYEPSEASIEWSVATASAANFPTAEENGEWAEGLPQTKKVASRQNHRSGLFMGCTSDRAVSIVPSTSRVPEKCNNDRSKFIEFGGQAVTVKNSCASVNDELHKNVMERSWTTAPPSTRYNAGSRRSIDLKSKPEGSAWAASIVPGRVQLPDYAAN